VAIRFHIHKADGFTFMLKISRAYYFLKEIDM
jgi:hypothetical protein